MHHQWEYLTNEQINTAVYNQIRLSPTEVTCWKYSTTQCGKNSWIQIWSQREHYCEITNLRSASVLPIHSLLSMISETKCTLPDAQTTLKNLRSNWICRFTGQPQATAGNSLPRMLQDKYWCLPAGQCQLFLFCRSPCSSPRNGLLDHGFSTRWDPHQTDEEAALI